MKTPLLLSLTLISGTLFAQAMTPAQHAAYTQQATQNAQQQQWQQQQNIMGNNMARCGDIHGYGCQQTSPSSRNSSLAQQQAAIRATPAHMLNDEQRQMLAQMVANADVEEENSYGAIALGYDVNAAPGHTSPEIVAITKSTQASKRQQIRSQREAESAALNLCQQNGGQNCRIVASYVNMCNSIAGGALRNGNGWRYYTVSPTAADLARAQRAETITQLAAFMYAADQKGRNQATENALAQCQRDRAIDAATCTTLATECTHIW